MELNIERFIRPSNLSRLAACPGAAVMSAAVTEQDGETPVASEADLGTSMHAIVARGITHWIICQDTGEHGASWGDCIAMVCNEATADGMDSWSVRCIQMALEFTRDLIAKHDIAPENVLVEHQLDMASTGIKRKGTADLILVVPFKRVIINDFKFGFLDQGDAEDHDQLSAYASAAAETFKCNEILVYIHQPRAVKKHRITAATFDSDSLKQANAWARSVTDAARASNPPLCPAYAQCVTCPAMRRCPASRKYIMDTMEALELLGQPQGPEQWGTAIGAAKLAEKFFESWRDEGRRKLLDDPKSVAGWTLKETGSITTMSEPLIALQTLEKFGITASKLMQAEALKFAPGQLWDEAEELVKDHIIKKPKSPSLMPAKREIQ